MNVIEKLNEFILFLNCNEIGQQILNETDKRLKDLIIYGLDERIKSAVMEAISFKIFSENNYINNNFNLKLKTKSREFYDGLFENEPIDIKISNATTQDNLNCQGAILYCLTGNLALSEMNKNLSYDYINKFRTYSKYAIDNFINKDFYYIILNKQNGNYKLASLKTLHTIKTNQSNFLQSPWKKNLLLSINRNTKEFIEWIEPHILDYRSYK